jgi:hypothetical protein
MSWSYLPRWKFTDSCGRPRVPGAIHVGCAHSEHTQCAHTSRRCPRARSFYNFRAILHASAA